MEKLDQNLTAYVLWINEQKAVRRRREISQEQSLWDYLQC